MNLTQVYGGTTVLMDWQSVQGAPNTIVRAINGFLSSILPQAPVFIVFLAVVLITILMRKHYRMNWVVTFLLGASIYLALRHIHIGDAI